MGLSPLACCAACPGSWAWGRRFGWLGRRGCGPVRAGQAAAEGGPHTASRRFSHSCSRCQPSGRCTVRWPRPCRAVRAATSIRSRRMVAARALACRADARLPAARVRLCAMAARASQAAFAADRSWPVSCWTAPHQRGIRASFVTGDEVYGGRELRRAIRARGMGYVLAVRANTSFARGSGLTTTAAGAVQLIPDRGWQRLRTGSGTKGVRHYDWAMLQITADDTPDGHDDGHSVLLIRRHRYTRTLSFYRCWTPGPVPLWRLIAVAQA